MQTASGGLTRETFPSCETVDEQGDIMVADAVKGRKGTGAYHKGKGKGGSGPKGRGKLGTSTQVGVEEQINFACDHFLLNFWFSWRISCQ